MSLEAVGTTKPPPPFTVPYGKDEKFILRRPLIDAIKGFTWKTGIHHHLALVGMGATGYS